MTHKRDKYETKKFSENIYKNYKNRREAPSNIIRCVCMIQKYPMKIKNKLFFFRGKRSVFDCKQSPLKKKRDKNYLIISISFNRLLQSLTEGYLQLRKKNSVRSCKFPINGSFYRLSTCYFAHGRTKDRNYLQHVRTCFS